MARTFFLLLWLLARCWVAVSVRRIVAEQRVSLPYFLAPAHGGLHPRFFIAPSCMSDLALMCVMARGQSSGRASRGSVAALYKKEAQRPGDRVPETNVGTMSV